MRTRPFVRRAAALAVGALVLAGCSDDATPDAAPSSDDTTTDDASTPEAAGETLRIGLINMENSPLVSAPEIRQAALAATRYVNEELDGIDGVPLELVTCVVTSAEDAQACTQQMASDDSIVSVINGVNAFNGFFDFYGTLSGKPVVGGVPLFSKDFNEPSARYFFGGSLSAFTGIGLFTVQELGAANVGVLYGENAAGDASRQALAQLYDAVGVEATYVPVPTPSTDVTPQVTQVSGDEFDAIVVVTAAAECAPVMLAIDQLGIDKSKVVYTGTCGADDVMDQAGAQAVGSWMHNTLYGTQMTNVPEDKIAEAELTTRIYDEFSDEEIIGGGLAVLGLASVLNIHDLYEEIGVENLDAETILATMDDGTPRNAHAGTPWVCNNPAFISVCNADNFFSVIEEPVDGEFRFTIGDPVDALKFLAEAQAGG